MFNLTLLVPGLLGSFPGLPDDDKPRFPAVEGLLVRAAIHRYPHRPFYQCLYNLFDPDPRESGDLPIAPISRLIDAADRPDGVWMRADPVHLALGRDGLKLVDSSMLSLTQRDAIVLAAALEGLFQEYNLVLEVPLPDRWYARLPRPPVINTTETGRVAGRDIHPYLPSGADSDDWLRLANEVQMLLHGCELNREREQRGELTVNSLWFWGAGILPEILPRRWTMVYSDDPAAQGLAMLSSAEFDGIPETLSEVVEDDGRAGEVLVASAAVASGSKNQDMNIWLDSMQSLENHWFEPLVKAVSRGSLNKVTIITDDRTFVVTRYSILRFWRRQRAVTDYL